MRSIERTLVGWFEASGYHVEFDGNEWFVWVGEKMLPLTEIAVSIAMDLPLTPGPGQSPSPCQSQP